ncbi:hypothetical protein Scep_021124 [Stephania cephalantha]|uniref:BTB domain-containing protein n=1 Tax=Stephania cephalantha TaxID=152367 RepID=A0AAP0I1A0_9MAGN
MESVMEESRAQCEEISSVIVESPPFSTGSNEDQSSSSSSSADVRIVTSGGLCIPVHSNVLAAMSTVLEKILDRLRKHQNSKKIIPIHGVPCNAVAAFVRFLYTSRCEDEELEKYGVHLLTLGHVFSTSKLKQRCARELGRRLTVESVVDVLQLARLCDAPDLYLKCMNLVLREEKAVQGTEGWKFLQDNDPYLELEILQFLEETESRQKRWSKTREKQSSYEQLSEAMESLQDIFAHGCTNVKPHHGCYKHGEILSTSEGLHMLIQHFATCKKKVGGKCCRCKQMWQLLRLHSSICDQSELCSVPLCRQFKLRTQLERKGDDGKWKLLVRKIMSAKAMSSLTLPTMNTQQVRVQ